MTDRVYVFDLDDTLYLERDYVRSGFRQVGRFASERYGVDGVAEFAWSLFEGDVRGDTFDRVAERFDLPNEAVSEMIANYRDHEPVIALQPDAARFLECLPEDAVGTGIITDGYAPGQWQKLKALGIDRFVDHIVVTGDFGPDWTKPSEYAFRRIQSGYGRTGIEFVYYGDNPAKDFQAPRRLGWRTVRVRRPQGLHHFVDAQDAADETISEFPVSPGTAATSRESEAPR